MQTTPVPDNEKERLKALSSYNILDTLPEKEFDEITELASAITGTPICLISLIDKDRQWFKSKIGLDVDETPRNISFCQYAILENKVYEIEDATQSALFKKNPLVTGDPNIKFYAGAPLTDPNGYNLGTLCVIDRKPYKLTSQQTESLNLLAKSVVNLLLLKKKNEENKIVTQRLIDAQTIAKIGSWEFNTETNELYWSKEHYTIFELEDVPPEKLYKAYRERIHPDDLKRLDHLVNNVILHGDKLVFEHRAVFENGRIKYLMGLGNPMVNNKGKIVGIRGTCQDITDRKEGEKEKSKLKNEIENFFDLTLDLMCIANVDGTFKSVNNSFIRELGYAKKELENVPFIDFIHPEDLQATYKEIDKLSKGHMTIDFENRYRKKDGSYIWLSWRAAPDTASGDLFATARNVTQAKKESEELKIALKNVEDYKYALDQSSAISISDADGVITYVNDNLCDLSCYQRDELIGKNHRILNSGFHSPDFFENLWMTIKKGKVWNGEIKNQTKHGQPYWIDSTIVPFINSKGIPYQYIAIRTNITQKKEFEKKIADTLTFVSTILNSTDYSIIATETNGIIKNFNAGAEKLLGYKADEVIGKETPAIIHDINEVLSRTEALSTELNETIEPGFETFIAKTKKTGIPDNNEWTYIRKDGSKIPVSLSVNAIRDSENNIIGYLGIAKDITEERERVRQILTAKEAAEHYAQIKQDFLANMSHEIRTPMNAILGFTQLLLDKDINDDLKEYVQAIDNSSKNLLIIINDVLDVSKLESGKLQIENTEFDLLNLQKSLLKMLESMAEKKGLKLKSTYDKRIPEILLGDPLRISQIMINLLSNAIKFTNKGSVTFSIRLIHKGNGNCVISFEVIDTGIGIEKEKLKFIFENFTQANSNTTREFGGTGLGLSIAQNLVKLMGGEITVESEVSNGSVFHFNLSLPFTKKIASEKEKRVANSNANHSKPFENIKVLLAEDNLLNQKLISAYLNKLDCVYEIAATGVEAVEKFKKGDYDIILMDVQMPEMDGLEATKTIRKLSEKIPIIAITANAFQKEKDRCLNAGMNDYLSKPFKLDELKIILKNNLINKNIYL